MINRSQSMFANQFVSVTHGFSDRQRQAAELLIAGVAFQDDGRNWTVFSYEGDEIGKMSTFMVNETTHMLKKAGLKVNNWPGYKGPNAHPCPNFPGAGVVTFGHNHFPPEEVQRMMDRRFNKPLTLL
jgi:hypothetical protein